MPFCNLFMERPSYYHRSQHLLVADLLCMRRVVCVKWQGGGGDRGSMDKQERMMASLREREKVVQQSLSVSLRERDREREQHLKEEAIQHFSALMADMVTASFFYFDTRGLRVHPYRQVYPTRTHRFGSGRVISRPGWVR